ncbi:sporulation protein [Salicibibacter cibarius]|uniref:Sporulation protein n=1 Tax=Salicibibacter cibarius TaxID=2743000 RepID=A0A7T6Z0I2_9BACI|nr:CAP domain-containing protein [Salicibibacter cibarius]QQK74466.1 sporulation protein [Salicibibacter cibarius]
MKKSLVALFVFLLMPSVTVAQEESSNVDDWDGFFETIETIWNDISQMIEDLFDIDLDNIEIQPPGEQNTEEEASDDEPSEQDEALDSDRTSEQDIETGSEFEQEVVRLTNEEREAQGLEPLEAHEELAEVAAVKSEDMRDNNYFSHESPTHGSPFEMISDHGIDFTVAGENIAAGQPSPEQVVEAWMDSEGHRANILNDDFTHIGIGHVEGGSYGEYWTQMFLTE